MYLPTVRGCKESKTVDRQSLLNCLRKWRGALTHCIGVISAAMVLLAFGVARAGNSGPYAGGNTLTITGAMLGNGSDITNVTICGVEVAIQSQTANSVTVLLGAGGSGTGDIDVYSASVGVTTFANGYTYNPPGVITLPWNWLSVSNLPAPRLSPATASMNGKIYAIGGYADLAEDSEPTVYVYDSTQPSSGWLSVNNLPFMMSDMAAVSANGKIYAIGGLVEATTVIPYVYVYDPAQPSLGWVSVSSLPAARCDLGAVTANGKIYAIGGTDSADNIQSTVYVYDPTQPSLGWLSVSNLPAPRAAFAAASVNGKIYAIGGLNKNGYGTIESTVYVYDTAQPSQGWLSVSNLPGARWAAVAASVNSKIYCMGGDDASFNLQPTIYVYDPSQPTQGWLNFTNLPSTNSGIAAASVNGSIYVIGGVANDTVQSSVYEGSFPSGVMPASGPLTGGNTVTINGFNLGNGDVTNVTLCGIPATILADNSPTQIVVSAGATTIPVNGNVVVNSTSYGVTVASNAYIYLPPATAALPATNVTVNGFYANWSSVSGATNYLLDVSTVSNFSSCLSGYGSMNLGNVTTFWVNGLNAGTTYYYRVRYQSNDLSSDYSSTISVQTVGGWISASNGPAAGGNVLTISGTGLGSGSDVTNVTICGVPALILSQTGNSVTVVVLAGGSGTGNIQVYSTSVGVTTFVNAYTCNAGPIMGPVNGSLSVNNGPAMGGNTLTIRGTGLGNGSDILNVMICGVEAAIQSQTANSVTVLVGAGVPGTGGIQVYSTSVRVTTFTNAYTYNPPGAISAVVPAVGSLVGGNSVTISGANLDKGDVTQVTLCGIPAVIQAESPTQIIVTAMGAAIVTNGAVVVTSISYGTTVASNAYTYLTPPTASAATGITLNSFYANWNSASGVTNYLLDVSTTSSFTNCVAGYTNLSVGNVTTFWVSGLNAGTTYYYRVRCQEEGLTSGNSSTISVQTLNVGVSVGKGPAMGGNTITIMGTGLGNGSDITNVTICGVTAAIQSQTANSVTVVVGAGASGTGNVQVYSASAGVTTFVNGYTYNPLGYIYGQFLGWSQLTGLKAMGNLVPTSPNGKVYAISGASIYAFDPSQPYRGWSSATNLPASISVAVGANAKIYAFADGFYVYDPSLPALSRLSTNPPSSISAAASANGIIYAIGGGGSHVYSYDPSQPTLGWNSVTNLPTQLGSLAAMGINGKIYVIGGSQSSVYVYNPSLPAQGWLNVSNLSGTNGFTAQTTVNGEIYAFGDHLYVNIPYEHLTVPDVYVYDPSSPTPGWGGIQPPWGPGQLLGSWVSAATSANGNLYAVQSGTSVLYQGSFAPGVAPSSGTLAGSNTITISGNYLGKGDVTNVTLCGVPATILADNSPTQVVVNAGATTIAAIGDVVVNSTSSGATVASQAYTYLAPVPIALAATDILASGFYANWSGVSAATNYLLDVSTSSNFTTYVSGYTNLSVGNATSFSVNGLNAMTTYYYRVRCQENGVISSNSSTIYVETSGGLSMSSGPAAGGNLLTITGTGLGNGSDITNVTICGVAAVIESQTANSVTVLVATGSIGTGTILIYSASTGVTTFATSYAYNQPGVICSALVNWSSISNLPVPSFELAAASVNGKIYAMGGEVSNQAASTVYVYDPARPTQGWLSVSSLPMGLSGLAAASVNGRIYAMGGWSGNSSLPSEQSGVYVYDPAQPAQGWQSVSSLPVALQDLAAVSANGKIYAIGGWRDGNVSTVYVYDPSQPALGWLSVSNLPVALWGLAAVSVNGKIYAIGGVGPNSYNVSTVYVYDPSQPTQGWLNVSNLPLPLSQFAATTLNDHICAIGGFINEPPNEVSTVYIYDPAQPAQAWLNGSNLPVPLFDLAAATANGKIYAIGGNFSSTVYEGSFAPGVAPSSGPLAGGNTVTISGYNLGNRDVTNVTLCGIPATILTDNSPNQIIVSAGTTTIPGIGDVVVRSTSYGVTVASSAYSYMGPLTITTAPDGTNLQLSWPTNCLGWVLEAQTNPLGGGLSTSWFPVAGSSATNCVPIVVDPNNGSAFFRLRQQ